MPQIVRDLLFISLISLPFYSWSIPSDREQPIEIEADHAQLDDQRGTAQYKGKAILTQGTLRIEGDRITFYSDDDKQLTKAVAQGKRVRYQQIQKIGEDPVRAEALQMEFHANTQKIILLGNAHVWQNEGEFMGQRIEYDVNKNIVNVSDRISPTDKPKKGERVHIILQPTSDTKNVTKPIAKKPATTQATTGSTTEDQRYPTAMTITDLNIRTGPDTHYNKLGTLASGTQVLILTTQKTWVQVRGKINEEPVIGWVSRQYLQLQ